MGIAHLGEVEARSAARSAVQQFNGAPYAELHNRLTWKWLAAGSAMRAQVDRFIEGSSRAELPRWMQNEIAQLRFTPLTESNIEVHNE